MKPPLFLMLFAIVAGIAIAVACALFAAQPGKVAGYFRKTHLQGPQWARNWPFASMVMKQWYPTYLRIVGIGGFFCALIWLALVIHLFAK